MQRLTVSTLAPSVAKPDSGGHCMRNLLLLVFLCASVCLESCASAPRVAAERNAEQVRSRPPVACRLALTVSEAPSNVADATGMRLTKDAVGMRDALVGHLSRLDTASVVFGASNRSAVRASDADIVLDLKISGSPPKHRGLSSGWWSSGLLWVVTWIGGLFTDDSTYMTDLTVNGSLTHVDSALIGPVAGRSGEIDLHFWNRNKLLSWRTLQSMILPPFWTSDDAELTSEQLTDLAAHAAAVQIADYIKRRLEEDAAASFAKLVLIEPANNGVVVTGTSARLHFAIESKDEPVKTLAVAHGGRSEEVPLPANTGVPGGYRCEVKDLEIELRPGENLIQIVANVGGRRFARTLRLRRAD